MKCEFYWYIIALLIQKVWCDFYSTRYDQFDITPLLENDRILLSYVKCFLDNGPCTPDARDFKKVIPEVLQSMCGKCTSKQSHLIKSVITALKNRYPDAWSELLDKYDEDGKYRSNFIRYLLQE